MSRGLARPWFKYWPPHLPRELEYPEVPIFDIIEKSAKRFPNKVAVIFYGKRITYSEIYRQSLNLAGYLASIGVRKGDRVAVCIGNSPHWYVNAFGVLRANAILVSINPLLSEDEIKYILDDSGAKVVITLSDNAKTFIKLKHRTNVKHIICGHWRDYLPEKPEIEPPKDIINAPPIPEDVDAKWIDIVTKDFEPPPVEVSVDDKAMIIYTSGTTGVPKGVVHTHRTMWPSIMGSIAWFNRTSGEVNLSSVAIFHVTGLAHNLYAALEVGATVVLMARWDPRTAAEMIQKYRVTTWINIPTVVIDLLNMPDIGNYDLSSLKVVGGGGVSCPEAIAKRLKELTGVDYLELYGYTESFSQTHGVPPNHVKFACAGIPHFGVDALIIDPETLRPLPPYEKGEIVVSSPNMFVEYWNKPEQTKEAFIEIEGKRYFRSGDLGYMDEDGFFFVVDRIKRMINRAGFKVWPTALENKMYEHPAVAEVCIVGTPDPRVIEEVKAYIVLKDEFKKKIKSGEIKEEELKNQIIEWCRQRMARYEYPRIIEFIDELPKTASGKILWRVLQDKERKIKKES
ncbi:long-chain-fatty-acid--CoA ligase [Desulfurococcaceae archaeon AG1]|jgi:fatty-acyl-CoA synthase|nr:long-chain-fatty-acid--CoA ligase [Desulfurococcaceae archaeon AG1]